MFCKSCQTWEFAAEDVHCSWCGATLVDAHVSFDAAYIYTGAYDLMLTLTVKHTGAIGTVELGTVEASTVWVQVDSTGLEGKSLESGEEVSLPVRVDTRGLPPDDYHQVEILVQTSVGERSVTLESVPKPKPEASLGEYTVLLDRQPDERVTGYLSLTRGMATVTQISTDAPWARVTLSDKVSLPHRLDARANLPLEFKLDIDEVYLLTAIEQGLESPPITYKANLVVEYAELTPPREYPFYVKCFLPPLLKVPEAEEQNNVRIEVFTGRRAEVDLTLRNGEEGEGEGRAELQILDILVEKNWLQPTSPLTYPINIPSGGYLHVTYTVQTDLIGEGSHLTKLTFLTNAPGEGRQKEYFVEAFVRQMPDYDGVVAIDFGTTNSCCAFLDKSTRHGLIPIDEPGSGKQTVASSTILYHDLFETGEKDYEIGGNVYAISFHPAATFSAVRQVKKRLGSSEPYSIIFYKAPDKRASYLPSEVATDILKRILERAEGVLKKRISSCTISHPSRFSIRQIEDLKSALTACGVKKVKTIHDHVAAALDFIRRGDVADGREQYHLLVYDFGGGTTDVTLLRVRRAQHPMQNLSIITPKVLGATGDPLFGGENVTDIVMTLGHEKCEQMLRDRYPNATNFLIPFYAENFKNNERRRRLAHENRNKLRRWAELSKIAIVTYGDAHMERLKERDRVTDKGVIDGVNFRLLMEDYLQLEAIVDNEIKKESFAHRDIVPTLGELDIKLRPAIEGIVELVEGWAVNLGVKSPDVILLSGKSSALPVVRELMAGRFPQAKVEMAGELKECVVRGACQLSVRDPHEGVRVKLDHSTLSATTSRLGIAVWAADGQGKFKEIIGAGVPIEEQGLRRAITDVSLERDTEIRLLENTGAGSKLVINNLENQHIKELKVFSIDSKLSEWERAHNKHISPEELEAAEIELEVTPNLTVRLVARVPGVGEPLEFEAQWV